MPAAPIQFFNRLTQSLETEAVYGEGPLRFVYENPLGQLALHALVKRALKLVNASEYKRNQFCPIIRVSTKAFGVGRRLPIVAKYLS